MKASQILNFFSAFLCNTNTHIQLLELWINTYFMRNSYLYKKSKREKHFIVQKNSKGSMPSLVQYSRRTTKWCMSFGKVMWLSSQTIGEYKCNVQSITCIAKWKRQFMNQRIKNCLFIFLILNELWTLEKSDAE